ncbi:MAG: hypothetical protein ACYC6Y_03760 [Thermoguttaceae bacterium]
MLRAKMGLVAAALVVAGLVAVPVRAGDALKLVPADALGVVVVDNLEALDRKVGKAGQSLKLPMPGPLAALRAVPGLSDCLDQKSPIVVALLQPTEAGGNPLPVAFVPVTDFAAFTKLFGGEAEGDAVHLTLTVASKRMLAAEKDGFAVLVPEGQGQALKTLLESAGGLAGRLGDDMAWLEQRDVVAVMTEGGISVFCAKILEGMEVAQEAMRAQGKDPMGVADILKVYKSLFAMVDREMELAAVGLDVEESGDLVLQVRKRFVPDGRLAKCLAVPAAPADVLAGLPVEPFVFAGGGQLTPELGKLMMEFSVEVMKAAPKLYGITEEQAEEIMDSASPLMTGMQSLSMMFATGSRDDTMYSRMVGVMQCDDTAKYMKDYEKYMQKFAGLMKDREGVFSMSIESKPAEIDGRKGLEISMEMPTKFLAADPNAEAMLEKMIGPEGKIRVFVVAADDRKIVFGYTNQNLLKKALAAIEEGKSLSHEESVKTAAARLGEGNFGRGYLSPAGLVGFVNSMIETMAPEGQKIQLPAFPETPPVAWTISTEGSTADVELVVPGELIQAGVGYAAQVRQTFEKKNP